MNVYSTASPCAGERPARRLPGSRGRRRRPRGRRRRPRRHRVAALGLQRHDLEREADQHHGQRGGLKDEPIAPMPDITPALIACSRGGTTSISMFSVVPVVHALGDPRDDEEDRPGHQAVPKDSPTPATTRAACPRSSESGRRPGATTPPRPGRGSCRRSRPTPGSPSRRSPAPPPRRSRCRCPGIGTHERAMTSRDQAVTQRGPRDRDALECPAETNSAQTLVVAQVSVPIQKTTANQHQPLLAHRSAALARSARWRNAGKSCDVAHTLDQAERLFKWIDQQF